jgi:hypothetical protein
MQVHDRIKSEHNTGTVLAINTAKGFAIVRWDGFGGPVRLPLDVAQSLPVVGSVRPPENPPAAPMGWDTVEV